MDAREELNLKQAVPFLMVKDIGKSLEFYVNGLGFEVKMDWRPEDRMEWCWLEREGVAIMLQEYRKSQVPPEKPGAGISICIMCRDALQLYHEFLANGLKPIEPFVGNNLWVVQLKDSDNYHLAFESPTDVPEETTYADWKNANKLN